MNPSGWMFCALLLRLDPLLLASIDAAVPSDHEHHTTRTDFYQDEHPQYFQDNESSGVIPKTVFSSKLRLVFVVGLEGAGHHYLVGALEAMFAEQSGTGLVPLNKCRMAYPYIVLNSMDTSPSNYTRAVTQAEHDMEELASEGQGLPTPGSIAMIQGAYTSDPEEPCYRVAMLSYPNFTGWNKVFKHVDLRRLAANAEKWGVDLRVIYLKRSAKDMFISNMMHRRFQNLHVDPDTTRSQFELDMFYMRTLFTEAGVMHSLLAEVAPEFVICHEYANLGDEEQASRIADFVAPSPEVAVMVRRSLLETAQRGSPVEEKLPAYGETEIAARLQLKLNIVDSLYC